VADVLDKVPLASEAPHRGALQHCYIEVYFHITSLLKNSYIEVWRPTEICLPPLIKHPSAATVQDYSHQPMYVWHYMHYIGLLISAYVYMHYRPTYIQATLLSFKFRAMQCVTI